MAKQAVVKIPMITSDGVGASYFDIYEVALSGGVERMLSEQQHAENFRLRRSDASYESDFHTAGDPTLLIILKGAVEIQLRHGESAVFEAGDMFVAADYLATGVDVNEAHGHKAKVVGGNELHALHLKLEKR